MTDEERQALRLRAREQDEERLFLAIRRALAAAYRLTDVPVGKTAAAQQAALDIPSLAAGIEAALEGIDAPERRMREADLDTTMDMIMGRQIQEEKEADGAPH